MKLRLFKYAKDPTGQNIQNRVRGEVHDISRRKHLAYIPVVLEHGAFYREGLVIRDNRGVVLVPQRDYQVTGLNGAATAEMGREVYTTIVVTRDDIGTLLYIDAQMVGGEYANVTPQVVQLAEGLLADERPAHYALMHDKPNTHRPTGHLMGWWEFYRFENWAYLVSDITYSVYWVFQNELYEMIREYNDLWRDLIAILDELFAEFYDHVNNFSNPHRDTKAHIGLSNLHNYPRAVWIPDTHRAPPFPTDRYLTSNASYQQIVYNFTNPLRAHATNYNNPHRETAAQWDTYTIPQINNAINNKLDTEGTAWSTAKIEGMTPQEIKEMMDAPGTIPIGSLGEGIFDPNIFGSGYGDGRVLMGDRSWRLVSELLAGYQTTGGNVYFYGFTDGWQWVGRPGQYTYTPPDYGAIRVAYSHAPIGSIVLFNDRFYMDSNEQHDNGAHVRTDYRPLAAMVRTGPGVHDWSGPAMYFAFDGSGT